LAKLQSCVIALAKHMKNLSILSSRRRYKVLFANSAVQCIGNLRKIGDLHVLIDASVYNIYKKELKVLTNARSTYIVETNEKQKTLKGVENFVLHLLNNNVKKNHTLIVIGGGIAQDMGAFTASVLFRGIQWIFLPTTLLSMADSCIGSKSSINVQKYKNQIGTFYPPLTIFVCTEFLKTLPKTEVINGFGEIIKHAIIRGGTEGKHLLKEIEQYRRSASGMKKIIYSSLVIKKRIIEQDEFDTSQRRLLNYGHTFGHALEGYTKNIIPHGIAVMIGMDIANYISYSRRLLNEKSYRYLHELLFRYIPDIPCPIKSVAEYFSYLHRDKKTFGSALHAVLAKDVGNIQVIPIQLDEALKKNIQDYVSSWI